MMDLKSLVVMLFLICSLVFNSCVDRDLAFPETGSSITNSISLVTFLNSISNGQLNENEVQLRYPVKFAFDDEVEIVIENFSGLIEAINSQSQDFFINSIQFPIEVRAYNLTYVITSESDFNRLLVELEISTLKKDLLSLSTNCFSFNYPLTLLNNTGNAVTIEDQPALEAFFDTQTDQYQPNFVFPIEVIASNSGINQEWNNYYDVYQLLNNCSRCPDIFFEALQAEGGIYYFITENMDPAIDFYELYINDQLVSTDTSIHPQSDTLIAPLSLGVNEICLRTETESCPEGTEFCTTIEWTDLCPNLFFTSEQQQGTNQYIFTAAFAEQDSIFYEWVISQDEQQLLSESEAPGGDNTLIFQFSPGTYSICIQTETPECPQLLKYCEELVIN